MAESAVNRAINIPDFFGDPTKDTLTAPMRCECLKT